MFGVQLRGMRAVSWTMLSDFARSLQCSTQNGSGGPPPDSGRHQICKEPLDGTEQTNTILGEAARDTYVPRQTERRAIADHQSMRQECAAESGTVAYLYQHEIGRGRLDLKAQLCETLSQQLARVPA